MQKIPSLFLRDWEGDRRLVTDQVNPEAQWVVDGEGLATVKWDGTACLVRDGKLYKRYDARPGRTPPDGFEPCGEPDPDTGRNPGWLPVGDGPEDRYHREAFEPLVRDGAPNGTYELIGPKVQGNPYSRPYHALVRHGDPALASLAAVDFAGLKTYLAGHRIEGIVWHHPDGRMAKIKRKDFGLTWP